MAFWKKTGKVVGHLFDIRVDKWIDYKSLKRNTAFFIQQGKSIFNVEKATREETFEEAMERLQLTPEMIEEQSKRYLFFTYLFLLLSFFLLLYGIIVAFHENWMGLCIITALLLYSLVLAFRFHFWYFQMKQKKLGCNLREWFKAS